MWSSGWVLVPPYRIKRIVRDPDDWRTYPCVSFPDGEVEGSDINRLWRIVQGSSASEESVWGQVLVDGPDGECKWAHVRREAIETFAKLSDFAIREAATAWQQCESETSSLPWWHLDAVIESVRELAFLARLSNRGTWPLLMVWYV